MRQTSTASGPQVLRVLGSWVLVPRVFAIGSSVGVFAAQVMPKDLLAAPKYPYSLLTS
jgi:hypothetical protein